MSNKLKFIISTGFYLLFIAAVFALIIYSEMSIWDECRQTNSFWYCMRVLSK